MLIAFLLPFVPESQIWRERRQAGTLKRRASPNCSLPNCARVTLVSALLSACAYAAAFGALQLTPLRIAPGLPELADQRKALKPLRDEASQLNAQLNADDAGISQGGKEYSRIRCARGRARKSPHRSTRRPEGQ